MFLPQGTTASVISVPDFLYDGKMYFPLPLEEVPTIFLSESRFDNSKLKL